MLIVISRSLVVGLLVLLTGYTASAAEPAPSWTLVTPNAGWQQRDSQGEVVFQNKLWIFGGWFDSYEAPPRDIWSSPDGKTWTKVADQAPWKHSDLPMMVVFKDKVWLMGGWHNGRLPGHSASSEVWSSSDGKNWEQVTAEAGWSPRLAAGLIVFDGKMWILGGTENYYFGDQQSLKNDVWSSEDGKTWTRVTEQAPWPARAYHAAVAHDGKMWVMGGGNYVPEYAAHHDVWSSIDGKNWTRETAAAPWHERLWFSSVVYRDHIWVLGGWSKIPDQNWGDVWYSRNGRDWRSLKSPKIWKERHEHSAYVFQDKIWVAGGHARPLSSEVWSLEVSKEWLDAHPPVANDRAEK